MTDQTAMSAEEKFGRELVARTAFQKEAVWLPSLAVHHMNAGQTFIDGKTFTECLIEGPAVMAVMDGTTFDGCNMGMAEDPRTLLLDPRGEKIAGVIGMANCRFERCRFVQVGFTAAAESLDQLEQGLLSARAQAGE
ncbi:hypothetical protein D8I30_04555 [Brevundimonas naejangsanensis]|uniref:Uncharacterized protein n=1 Tax=Brevundimonas naejangsanensis TaxID=588932 RepID=A0A494RHF9_9CAUL|nr:hypothetical protein [Brevundimonas naejangsanensis]AYG94533.1 hypothetical protein D8I30_04555 [Brevundimonas naejangsanensis]